MYSTSLQRCNYVKLMHQSCIWNEDLDAGQLDERKQMKYEWEREREKDF